MSAPEWMSSIARSLALDDFLPPQRHPLVNGAIASVHLLMLSLVCRLAHWPLWLAPTVLAVVSLPALVMRCWRGEILSPLGLTYALAGVRLGIVYGLRQSAPPELSYGWGLAVSVAWCSLIGLRLGRRCHYAAGALSVVAILLVGYVFWLQRPAGVTGSDPYVYVQMGLDLAQRGTLRHHFPLAPVVAAMNLSVLPTTHVGYVLPNAAGWAPSVWPPGYSVALAAAYLLGGEQAMLWLNGLLALISLGLTAWLTRLLTSSDSSSVSIGSAAVAVFLQATAIEQFTRMLVPLADIAAQMLTAAAVCLALWFAHRSAVWPQNSDRCPLMAARRQAILWGALTGLLLAAAFSVRYTQLLIAPGLLLIAGQTPASRPRWSFLIALTLAAAVGAIPDLVYRLRLYGAPWRFGSGELMLFSWQAIPEALQRLWAELFTPAEFGWLWPMTLLGVFSLWRRRPAMLFALATVYGPVILFHLWYPFVRLRDVLCTYAPLCAVSALGVTAATLSGYQRLRTIGGRLVLVVSLGLLCLWRLTPLVNLRHGVFTFGYLSAAQRATFESLTRLTEPQAIVAASLNSGAIELYGQRSTVRPGNVLQPLAAWTPEEWLSFVDMLRREQRPLYLLMDSVEMETPLATVRRHYAVTPVAELEVPVYFAGGGSLNLSATLYRLIYPPPAQ